MFPSSCYLILELVNTMDELSWHFQKGCDTQLKDVVGPRLLDACKVSMHGHIFETDVIITRFAGPGPTGVTGDTGNTGPTGGTGFTGETGVQNAFGSSFSLFCLQTCKPACVLSCLSEKEFTCHIKSIKCIIWSPQL